MGKRSKKHPTSSVRASSSKQPRSGYDSAERKKPRGTSPNVSNERPLWSLQLVDLDWPRSWRDTDSRCTAEVMQKLKSYESMTWQEIEGPTGSHFISVSACSKQARDRLQKLRCDDIDQLFSLRISGKRRVFGIREMRILRILWWDPEHEVCPAQKRHT